MVEMAAASSSALVRAKVDASETVARPYQLELLDAAIEENTIVLLGTGAGKTFIAVMLIRELSYQIVRPFGEPGSKRTVFLVNTVPLVNQQAQYIRAHISLNVGEYVGEMGVDTWGLAKWMSELNEHHILVLTRQIFLDMLQHNFVEMSQVNLIVFDECHHAVKNDPYVQIMKIFNKCDLVDRPQILGLSASIVSGKCKPRDLPKKLKELEAVLHSRIQTACDLNEVARFATNPEEIICSYRSADTMLPISIRKCLSGVLDFLYQQKSQKGKDYAALVSDVNYSLENISISSAKEAAEMTEKQLREYLDEDYTLTKWEKELIHLVLTRLAIFIQKCNEHLRPQNDTFSPKLARLLEIIANMNLGSSASSSSSPSLEKSAGIVFVERRVVAACLASFINKVSTKNSQLRRIKCAHMVGHGTGGGAALVEGHSSSMSVKKQQEILRQFRSGKINLLIATSVVEEGLDVRKCNLVVRYDFPKTFQSYVQSQGRARAKESRYVLLVQNDLVPAHKATLSEYHELAKTLQVICHHRSIPDEDIIERMMRQKIPPYQPFGLNGPQISIDGSLSLVHKYCQKLPKPDRFTVLTPQFTDTTSSGICVFDKKWYKLLYTFQIQLPMSSAIKEVTGPAVPSMKLAKKAAALEVVKQLHESGELNDHLKQVEQKEEDSDEEDNDKMEMKKVAHSGTKRKVQYYLKQVPQCLQNCYPKAGQGNVNHLYVFDIREANGQVYLSSNGHQCASLGILTSKPIPHWRVPQFSLYIKKNELSVSLIKNPSLVSLTAKELALLQAYHTTLFTHVLAIAASPKLRHTASNYLVVPIQSEGISLHYLDFEVAKHFAHQVTKGFIPSSRVSLQEFPGSLVSKTYHQDLAGGRQEQLYEVLNINQSENPASQFPERKTADTYVQYFKQRYNCTISDLKQPSLTCKPVGMGTKSMVLTTCNYKDAEQESSARQSEIKLFPELCKIHQVRASYWKLCRCVPSLLNRLQHLLQADELSTTVSTETRIGAMPTNGLFITTNTSLKNKTDLSTGVLSTRAFWNDGTGNMEAEEQHLDAFVVECDAQRMPDNALLLQAVTAASVNDSINLERLESLGDSFLKLFTSVDLYCFRRTSHEGRLTTARTRRISNFNLYYLAMQKGIGKTIVSAPFDPLNTWIPPCFQLSDPPSSLPLVIPPNALPELTRALLYQKVTDKSVADVIEALIGAYIVAGGIEAGFKFLKWLGLKIDGKKEESDLNSSLEAKPSKRPRTMSEQSAMSAAPLPFNPLLLRNSSAVFASHCSPPPSAILQGGENVDEGIRRMTSTCDTLMDKLNWRFQDRALLLQAITHPSYTKNRITDSYQRLEFLGDAILDYLVTCRIYYRFPNFSPGEITDMRSALVNNITFARIAAQCLSLNHYLQHHSPALFRQMSEFVEAIQRLSEVEGKDIYGLPEQQRSMESSSLDLEEGTSVEAMDWAEEEEESDDEEVEELDPPKALGDILEALAGAVFLDSGLSLETVWRVFEPFFEPLIDEFKDGVPIPPVKELYERERDVKVEKSKSNEGKSYRCTITVVGKSIQVSAVGKTYKAARNAAARRALRRLNEK